MILGHWRNELELNWQCDRKKETHEELNTMFSFPNGEEWTNGSHGEIYIFTDESKGEIIYRR